MNHKRAIISNNIFIGTRLQRAALIISGETIEEVLLDGKIENLQDYNIEKLDYNNNVVIPGIVDTHVHLNEPGRSEWEGFQTATQAAAVGGITTIVDMPLNCSPVTTTLSALEKKIPFAENNIWVDCGFYGGLIPENQSQLEPLIDAGVLGFKSFLCDSGIDEFSFVKEDDLRGGLAILKSHNVPLLVHAELESKIENISNVNPASYESFLQTRPKKWENDAIELMIKLSSEYNAHMHVVHLSSSEALPMLSNARKKNINITCETCHHYLTFSSEEISDKQTEFKCAPPIREKENQDRLWQAIINGDIDFVVSDHSPCVPNLKQLGDRSFLEAWGGIAGLQFGLSVFWTELRKRKLGIDYLVNNLCSNPAKFVGLQERKGKLSKGYRADITIFDPDASFCVSKEIIRHRHKLTPYLNRELYGKVLATYVGGRLVFDGEKILERAGSIVRR